MSCLQVTPRHTLQLKLRLLNPSFSPQDKIAPDDDADVAEDSVSCVIDPPRKIAAGY